MTYRVAIPSYDRPDICRERTLALLLARQVPAARIDVFVANEAEYNRYRGSLDATGVNIVIGTIGLGPQRNFITRYYEAGQNYVSADDDLTDLRCKVDDKTTAPLENLDAFFKEAFEIAEFSGSYMWGIYPVLNPMFMKDRERTGLTFCIGSIYGVRNRHQPFLDVSLCPGGEKEDYERTIRHYLKDGTVLRFDYVAAKTKVYGTPGGLQNTRSLQREESAVTALLDAFPELVHRRPARKSGFPEIRLADKRKVDA